MDMIHLFRRIRHKLFSNGKFTKYLFYAIGEIALVMIGILLALQVNNWNEHRKNTANKNAHCKQLITTLQTDLQELERYKQRVDLIQSGCQYVWDYVHGDLMDIDTNLFKMNFLNAQNSYEFVPNTTVFNNLIEGVGLSLIESDSLKNLFNLYYSDQGKFGVRKQREEYATAYADFRFEFCSPMMLKSYLRQLFNQPEIRKEDMSFQVISEEVLTDNIFDLSDHQLDWEKLKGSKEFKILLGRIMAIREPLFSTVKKTKHRITLMIDLLKKEIE